MTELKTLKDLKIKYAGTDNLNFVQGQSNALKQCKEELKAEAVKWVKDLNMSHQIREDGLDMDYCEDVLQWIKHFFNLKEEDLQ